MNFDFQTKLKSITFKTGLHNQEIGYADLFANRRALVLATPIPVNMSSWYHMMSYERRVTDLKQLGIDSVYCVSCEPLLIPYMDKHAKQILPIVDYTQQFVSLMAGYASRNTNIQELARMWEYVAVINNGNLEKTFSNPLKEGMSLAVYNHEKYRFRGIGPEIVISYLGNVAQ